MNINFIVPMILAIIISLSGQEFMEMQTSYELNMLNKKSCVIGIENLFDVDVSEEKLKESKSVIKIEENIDVIFDISDLSIDNDEDDEFWHDLKTEGKFTLNGHDCLFNAEGKSEVYELKTGDMVYTGSLDGSVLINDTKRDLSLGFEKIRNRKYLAFTIGNGDHKNGNTILFFGEPVITEAIWEEIDEIVDEADRQFDFRDLIYKLKYKIEDAFLELE